jgi:hypothetical protein
MSTKHLSIVGRKDASRLEILKSPIVADAVRIATESWPELDIYEGDEGWCWSFRCCEGDSEYSNPVSALVDFAKHLSDSIDEGY